MKRHAIIPVFISHRGCPNRCVFCNQKAITARDGDVTVQDAERTAEEWLSTLEGKDLETELSFFGGSFTGIPREEQRAFLELAKKYKSAGRIDKIHCSTRPDYIDEETLDMLKEYGMDVIELGVQSFSPKVLEMSRRGCSPEQVYEACRLIRQYGFTLGIQLMIGLPGDSREACMDSVRQTIGLKPDIARLYPTVVLEDTELCEMRKRGEFIPFSHEKMLSITTDMYRMLTDAGINVIRIGLKSNEAVKGDTYHPAFGQLVKSLVAREEIEKQLAELAGAHAGGAEVLIKAPPELMSYAAGHRAENRKYFSEKYPDLKIYFIEDAEAGGYAVCLREAVL